MSPKVKICNKIRDFLPLDVLLPLNLHGILGEDREQKIRATKKETKELELKQATKHVFPLLKTCDISPLEHQASGVFDDITFS